MPGEYIFEFENRSRVIFSSFTGESTWHVSLKLLAYLIYRRRGPLVERSVGQRYKPDLVVLRDERVRLWVDCGETSLRKLDRVVVANPAARIVIVKDTLRHLETYIALTSPALRAEPRLLYLAFSDGLVEGLSRAMRQRNRVGFAVAHASPRISLNGDRFDGELFRRGAPARLARRR